MNRVKATSNRLSKPLASSALLGLAALTVGGGCSRPSDDATVLAAAPAAKPGQPAPMMPGSRPPNLQTGAAPQAAAAPVLLPGSLPPNLQPGGASAPVAASVPSVVAAAPPPAVVPAPAAPVAAAVPVAPAPVPAVPYDNSASKGSSKGHSQVSMVLATPAGEAPRLVPGTLALKAQLKRLWKQGATAKHRGDTAGARKAWLAARRLAPQWPGFQESLDKLGH